MAQLNGMQLNIEVTEPATGMAQAVLRELAEHLAALAEHGHSHQIDLTSLPMSTGDKQQLASSLGKGEVEITLNTMGDSHIYETAYSGIWWIKHYSADEQLLAELIEVAVIPQIINSQAADIEMAANALQQMIAQTDSSIDTGEET